MFGQSTRSSAFGRALAMAEVVFHVTARKVRAKHNNAFIAIGQNMLQAVIFVAAFYVMFSVLGLRSSAVRGDFLLYMMSGIFLFMVHTKTVGAVVGAEGPTSPMMLHAPMNTIVAIVAAALSVLYIQVLDLATTLQKTRDLGGQVLREPFQPQGSPTLAWIADPEGNRVVLVQQ